MAELQLTLRPTPPFRLELAAWTLRRRAQNAVDTWDGKHYGRAIPLARGAAWLSVWQTGSPAKAHLHIRATGPALQDADRLPIRRALERLLGLRVDLRPFYRMARNDRRLATLAARFVGFKPPRFLSAYEALVNAIACQQLSLIVGIQLLNRLCEACRPAKAARLPGPPFPQPADVADLGMRRLRAMGFSRQKATSLLGLSRELADGRLDLEQLGRLASADALERLMQIRGIGRWSGEYALLRGFGHLDVFPGDDVGAGRRLAEWLGLEHPLGYAGVARVLEPWRKFAGLIYFHMLLDGLRAGGNLSAG